MTKKGPLGKAEMFYIQHHYKQNDVDTLAKELDRAKSLVESHVEKCKTNDAANETFSAANQFGYKKGSTIMTENASVLVDEFRQKKKQTPTNCVTKIK